MAPVSATTPGFDPNTTCTPQAVPEIAAQQDQPGRGISPTGTTTLPPSSYVAKHLDDDELVATTGPTNLEVCRHGPLPNPRRLANQPPAAQSLQGISTIAWGCHSAAPATPGRRPPPTTQL